MRGKALSRTSLTLEADDLSWWESLLLEKSLIVVPTEEVDIIKNDPDDNKFIEAALEGKAEYIVSQDKHLLLVKEYQGIKIIHPEDFLKLL